MRDQWLFLTQNPDKPSKYGKLAKEGHHIGWVINGANEYCYRYIDGVVESL